MPQSVAEEIDYGGLTIQFDDRVLRPRQWTLAQASWAAELSESAPVGPVLELCAGVGHIGLVATVASDRHLVMVDVNPVACEFARNNARSAQMGSRAEVREGRMEEVLDETERFSLIIADPPWVPTAETGRFPQDPLIAIDGGDDGLGLALVCCDVIGSHLQPGGDALLQLGSADQVARLTEVIPRQLRVVESRSYDGGVIVRLTR